MPVVIFFNHLANKNVVIGNKDLLKRSTIVKNKNYFVFNSKRFYSTKLSFNLMQANFLINHLSTKTILSSAVMIYISKRFYPGGKGDKITKAVVDATLNNKSPLGATHSVIQSNNTPTSHPLPSITSSTSDSIIYSANSEQSVSLNQTSSNDLNKNPVSSIIDKAPLNAEPQVIIQVHMPKTEYSSNLIQNAKENALEESINTIKKEYSIPSQDNNNNIENYPQKFSQLEKKEIIEYTKHGNMKLTTEAHTIQSSLEIKPVSRAQNTQTEIESREIGDYMPDIFSDNINNVSSTNENIEFVSGVLDVNTNSQTEILEPITTHPVVGIENIEKGTIEVFAYFTSDKGKQAGLTGYSSTIKVSDDQAISGKANTGQYLRLVIPPVEAKLSEFTPDFKGTEYANRNDVKDVLTDAKIVTDNYEPISYKSTGYTMADLERIEEIKDSLDQNQKQNEFQRKKENKHEDVD